MTRRGQQAEARCFETASRRFPLRPLAFRLFGRLLWLPCCLPDPDSGGVGGQARIRLASTGPDTGSWAAWVWMGASKRDTGGGSVSSPSWTMSDYLAGLAQALALLPGPDLQSVGG